jgi:hypothetical protein
MKVEQEFCDFLDGQIECWHILNDILDDILSTQGPSQHEERLDVSHAHALSAGGVKSQQAVPREGATLRGQTRVIKTFSVPEVLMLQYKYATLGQSVTSTSSAGHFALRFFSTTLSISTCMLKHPLPVPLDLATPRCPRGMRYS